MASPLAREPSPDTLSGNTVSRVLARYLGATRPMFLPASVLPVLVGSAWGWRAAGAFDPVAFSLALLIVVLVHAGANVANDVADELNGTDRLNAGRIHPFTGGSRFIQSDVLTVRQMTRWAAALLAAGIGLGLLLVALKGPWVLAFGIAGVGLGLAYSLPPLALSTRGIGEIAVAAGFGALPVIGSFWLQAGVVTGEAVLVSLPVSLWVMAVLVMNEVPDIAADAAAGKRTLVVRLGTRFSGLLYAAIHEAALIVLVVAAIAGLIPWAGLALPLLLLAPALWTARVIAQPGGKHLYGIIFTLIIHNLGALWLAGLAFFVP